MRIALSTIAVFVMTLAILAQQTQQPDTKVASSLGKLHSEDWTERRTGYEQLRLDPEVLADKRVQDALLDLLDRENQLAESTNREGKGPSTTKKYGEAYGEYISALGETVDSFADWTNPQQVCIFVREVYSPNSRFAAKIASNGRASVPCLVRMYGSDVGLVRADAAAVLVQALAKSRAELDPDTIETARRTIMSALRDPHEAVRSHTVDALAKFGDEDMIAPLSEVAHSDLSFEDNEYWIREKAAKAIAEIRRRAGQN